MTDYNIVSVSGGKDSTALLLLAIEREAENLRAVFADTGHEHPAVYEYLDYLEQHLGVTIDRLVPDFSAGIERKRANLPEKWREQGISEERIAQALEVLHPTGIPFLDLCLWKGRFPSTRARFCTEELKRNPIHRYLQLLLDDPDTGDVWSWQGVRADESASRAKLATIEESDKHPCLWHYRPILQWTESEVFDFHRKHGVKWNPLYEHGMSRVGCMPCVNCRKGELQEISRRFPEHIARVREWEQLVSKVSRRGSATFFPVVIDPTASASDDISPETHGIDRVVEWSKTTRGGRQFDLIASTAPSTGCASAYGLCET